MKAIALAKRLSRDLNEISVNEPTSDSKQELLDAINGALQRLDAIAPFQTKTTLASLYLDPAVTLSIGVTHGGTEITGSTFTNDQYGRTIRIEGDEIDNQISGVTSLLHPYTGPTGTVSATVYSDAIALPEPYVELVGHPIIIETGRPLCHHQIRNVTWHKKKSGEPRCYWVESNAGNRSPVVPAVIRFDTLPDRIYRIGGVLHCVAGNCGGVH